jgi:hypothetical protein
MIVKKEVKWVDKAEWDHYMRWYDVMDRCQMDDWLQLFLYGVIVKYEQTEKEAVHTRLVL